MSSPQLHSDLRWWGAGSTNGCVGVCEEGNVSDGGITATITEGTLAISPRIDQEQGAGLASYPGPTSGGWAWVRG